MEFLRPGHIIIAANLCGPPPVPSNMYGGTRDRHRFFDWVGHETKYAYGGNKHFSLNNVTVRPTKIMNRANKNWAHF